MGVTDALGVAVEQRFFDAWGNLKAWADKNGNTQTDVGTNYNWAGNGFLIDRGYTGHEHVWAAGLINMNARLYDPVLRRFMSADDVVPDLFNTQDYNRFGYGRNSPLLYIDQDGHEPITIGAALIAIGKAVAVAIVANGMNNLVNGVPVWYGMGKAATIGAVSGAVSFGIGSVASSKFGNGVSLGKAAFEAGAHGITGGLMSEANGGNFGSGFFSGMVSSAMASSVNALGTDFAASKASGGVVYHSFGENYMRATRSPPGLSTESL